MVTAVVLSYNRVAEVLNTLDKLKAYKKNLDFPFEIVVVDNASIDETSIKVKELHPDVTLVTLEKNVGIAGWNHGFQVAGNKYLLVLDDDSHIETGLPEAVRYLEENNNVGILAFQIRDWKATKSDITPEEAWQDNQDLPGFIGCGALIRKEVYKKIGGYAEWIHVYTHEFEYALRCLNAGYKVKFFAKGTVIHRTSGLNRTNERLRTFATRNEMAIVYKYFRKSRTKYLLRILFNNLKFIRKDGFKSALFILSGAMKFYKMRGQLVHSPVSKEVQDFYAEHFWSTQPIFDKIKKRLLK